MWSNWESNLHVKIQNYENIATEFYWTTLIGLFLRGKIWNKTNKNLPGGKGGERKQRLNKR